MPRRPRKTVSLPLVAHLAAAFEAMDRAEYGISQLAIHLRGREAEIAQAQNMIRACLDGTPLSVQYAAVLNLARHCVAQMQRNPDACPED